MDQDLEEHYKEEVKIQKLSDVDMMVLELAKSNRKVALAQAETALSKNELADVSYKYTVLQLYMKYGLTQIDKINEDGTIVFGGNVQGAK
jgi:hypothetical protein